MRNNPILALTAFLLVASSAVASAFQPQQPFQPDGHKKSAIKAGIVNTDGSIVSGTGYSVSHDGTGEYTIDIPAGQFKTCPANMVTPGGVNGHAPIADVYDYISCGNGHDVKFQVRIYSRTDGKLQDNAFGFVSVGT